ncbi:MAG: sel1 repeat family protein [Clostridiales bacterium]|nr:sel1 repeat family protein [Clostridiales bacterium]
MIERKLECDEKMREIKKSADQGNPDAQYEMAWYCLWESNEPPYDRNFAEAAVYYFQQAAGQGHSDAMLDLGALYLDGTIALKPDFDRAVYWYKKSAELLNPKAFRCLGYALGFHSFRDSYHDYEAAYCYFSKGAEMDEENSLYELGDLYAHGLYVEEDAERAFRLYQRSYQVIDGDMDNDCYADACLRIGECYMKGIGTEKDTVAARMYLEEAKSGYEYRLERDAPLEWIDNISSELDRVNRLLAEL